jgi:hypothetical protein
MKGNPILWLTLSVALAAGAKAFALPPPSAVADKGRLLDEIMRLTSGGFSDQTVLVFVKARRADIPPILTAEDFLRLRKTGVAETVIDYLSGASAIELDTAGRTAEMDVEPAKEPTNPEPMYLAPPYGYWPPYGGGYVGSSPFFPRHHFPRHRPALPPQTGFPRIGPNGFPILAPPNGPGGTPPPIGSNGFPVLSKAPGIP